MSCKEPLSCVPCAAWRRERVECPPAAPAPEPSATQAAPTSQQQQQLHISISGSSLELSEPPAGANRELVPFDSDDTDDEDSPSPSSTLQSQASHSTISSSFGSALALPTSSLIAGFRFATLRWPSLPPLLSLYLLTLLFFSWPSLPLPSTFSCSLLCFTLPLTSLAHCLPLKHDRSINIDLYIWKYRRSMCLE